MERTIEKAQQYSFNFNLMQFGQRVIRLKVLKMAYVTAASLTFFTEI